MHTKKRWQQIIGFTLAVWLLSGCGGAPTEPPTLPTPVPPTAVMESTPTVPAATQPAAPVAAQPATIIELPDGTRCSFAGTGATLAFEGKRLNYTCEVEGQEVGLLGDLQQNEGVWTVEKAVIGHGDSGFFVKEAEKVTMVIERIELADGTRCFFAGTGATLAFEGKRLNYTCEVEGQEVGLLGDLQPGEGVWTVEKAVIGHGDSGFFVKESEEVTIHVLSGSAVSAMPNPASAFCEEQGGRVDIRAEGGGQVGYCVFPDGSECEEWAFFRGECGPGSGYQPPSPAMCSDLADAMAQTLGVAVTTADAPFRDSISGKAGTGCQATATGTGLDFENHMVVADALREALGHQGWQADFIYAADGPTGTGNGFRKGNVLCLFSAGWEPSAEANCPSDQPISACELAPEQKLYTIRLNCAQDTSTEAPQATQPEPEPARIQFTPGAISGQVQGRLAAGGVDRYVLTAMAGQEMTVELSVATAEVSAILVIWGADGTVLISDHADATTWVGALPATQDYYMDVRSVAQAPVDYTLEVTIPPLAVSADFTGQWEWESDDGSATFTLNLTQSGHQLQGSHIAVMQGGNRIDSLLPDLSIFGSVNGHMAEVTFQSSFASTAGQATMTHHGDTITWKVTVPPDQYFVPDEVVLIRTTTP